MLRGLRMLCVGLGLAALMTVAAPVYGADKAPAKPKNVIIMIGDGCGFGQTLSGAYYLYGAEPEKGWAHGFKRYAASTYPVGGSYDPAKAWSDFEYVKKGQTDSAAAATALATGSKTKNGKLGVTENDTPLINTLQCAEKAGKSTGVVTSVEISHATPAGFVAHNASRGNLEAIAKEMLCDSAADVVMGAGHPWYDGDGKPAKGYDGKNWPEGLDAKAYKWVGGPDLWKQVLAGTVGGDADGDGKPDPWTVIQSREEFQKLMTGPTPKRVLGMAPVAESLQIKRTPVDDNPKDDVAGQTPLLQCEPTLAEMSRAALNVLDDNPNGLFLMIEGGAIDWAAEQYMGRMVEEVADFDRAIEAVIDWVEKTSSWKDTLLIVTADHETGYEWGPGSGPDWKPVVNNGKGQMPGVNSYNGGHTNSLVPVFVRGKGAEVFKKAAKNKDPKRGAYLDNTDIGNTMKSLVSR